MVVVYKYINTRGVICAVGGEQGIFCVGLGRRQLGCIHQKIEAPEFSTGGFTPTCEGGRVIWGKDCNLSLGKIDRAVCVTYFTNSNQCVF